MKTRTTPRASSNPGTEDLWQRSSPRRQTKGERTREEILRVAADVASAEGLEGLSIGALATRLDLSKSGLFLHFGSKEALQLATIDTARERFTQAVIARAEFEPAGLPRLRALMAHWLRYAEDNVFRGGCFFTAAAAEFDGRPGVVRTRLADLARAWLDRLTREARTAQAQGELAAEPDPEQVVFELHAVLQAANGAWQLLRDRAAFTRARAAIAHRLPERRTAPEKAIPSRAVSAVPAPRARRAQASRVSPEPVANLEWSPGVD